MLKVKFAIPYIERNDYLFILFWGRMVSKLHLVRTTPVQPFPFLSLNSTLPLHFLITQPLGWETPRN